jgi:hypothetical protein
MFHRKVEFVGCLPSCAITWHTNLQESLIAVTLLFRMGPLRQEAWLR